MASIAQQAQSQLFALISTKLGDLLSAELGGVPVAGSIMTGIMNRLWPSSGVDVWDSIKDDVQNLINAAISAEVLANTSARLEGLKKVLNDFLSEAKIGTPASILDAYIGARQEFEDHLSDFQEQGFEILLLPFYVQVVSLNLTLLRDGVIHGAAWGMDAGDVAKAQTELTSLISDGQTWVDKWYQAAMPSIGSNDYLIPAVNLCADKSRYVREMTLAVLDFRNIWEQFDPQKCTPGTPVPGLTREIYSDCYWYDVTDQSQVEPAPIDMPHMLLTGGDSRPLHYILTFDNRDEWQNDDGSPWLNTIFASLEKPLTGATITSADGDGWQVPRFDKTVVFQQRNSPDSAPWGDPNTPIPLPDDHVNMDLANVTTTPFSFHDHVVSSVRLWNWNGQEIVNVKLSNVVVGFRRYDAYGAKQGGWRECVRCAGLYYDKKDASVCPLGGAHDPTGSASFVLFVSDYMPGVEGGWKRCLSCGVAYSRALGFPSICPANSGGAHSPSDLDYVMLVVPPVQQTQDQFVVCVNCSAMYDMRLPSACPRPGGGWHSGTHGYLMLVSSGD